MSDRERKLSAATNERIEYDHGGKEIRITDAFGDEITVTYATTGVVFAIGDRAVLVPKRFLNAIEHQLKTAREGGDFSR